jgi:hypothetical protein
MYIAQSGLASIFSCTWALNLARVGGGFGQVNLQRIFEERR